MSNSNRFLEGITIGGLLGFFCGLLSAPKSGAELRKQLANESEDLYKQASESIADIKTKTNQAMATLQSKSEDLVKLAAENLPNKSGKKDSGRDNSDSPN